MNWSKDRGPWLRVSAIGIGLKRSFIKVRYQPIGFQVCLTILKIILQVIIITSI